MEACFPWRFVLSPGLYNVFSNDPGNIQRVPVNLAGDINLGKGHLPWRASLEFRVVLRHWRYCPKGNKDPIIYK